MTPPGHPRDLLAWHALCFAAMAGMLVLTLPDWLAVAGLALFAVGVLWCVARAVRPGPRASYVALGVCCAAMIVMLVPGGMAHDGMGARPAMSVHRGVLTGVLVAALVCVALVAAVRLARDPGSSRPRAATAAELILADLMAAMLAGVV
ncbi:MAG: hypothetical protein ABI776_07540 [Nocardioidaceae bacterium]